MSEDQKFQGRVMAVIGTMLVLDLLLFAAAMWRLFA